MSGQRTATGCAGGVNRRRFLRGGCAACLGAAGAMSGCAVFRPAPAERVKVRLVYALHADVQERPDWPNKGFDFRPAMARFREELARRCPGFDFVTSTATGPEQAKQALEADTAAPVDGYVVFQLNCWNRVVQTIAESGKPVLYVDFQFGGSGGFLVYTAGFLRKATPNVGFVASSNIRDVAEAVKCIREAKAAGAAGFAALTAAVRTSRTPRPDRRGSEADRCQTLSPDECVRRMKASKILAVRDEKSGPGKPIIGIPLEHVAFAEVNEAWKAADPDASRALADRWQQAAAKVEGVSRETLVASAAMYLGMKSVLRKHGANAITINCLGGFYGGHIHAYPCLGFHELVNEGLVGACECDVRSTATMVAISALTQGRPGYISDPVIDTAKRQIIYAHCVASNRVFGPDGRRNPFEILTHSEDRQGAAVRSILPVGHMTTSLEFSEDGQVVLHRAWAVANDPDDRACRTKLCAEPVGDIEKLFTEWDRWGWHRVTFYGDLKEPVYALAEALGCKVIEEA